MTKANNYSALPKCFKIKSWSKLFANTCAVTSLTLILVACGQQSKNTEEQAQQHLKQSRAYSTQGQYRAAVIEAKNAIQKSPDNSEAQLTLAKILNTVGQYPQAATQLSTFSEPDKTDDFFLTLAQAYNGYGKYRSALDTIKQIQTKSSVPALLTEATSLLNLKRFQEAEQTYASALKLDPSNVTAKLGMAKTFALRNEFHKTFELLNEIRKQAPKDPELTLFEANLAIRDGDLNNAETLLTQALQELPTADVMLPVKARVLTTLAGVLSRQGRPSEAMVYSKLLSDAFPGMEIATGRYQEALTLIKNNQIVEAQRELQSIISDYPGFSKAKELLATINYLHGDLAPAEEYLDNEFDPELASVQMTAIAAANKLRLNDPANVVQLLEDQIATTDSPEILALYGLAAMGTGKKIEGEKAALKAIQLNPTNSRLSIALAQMYNSVKPPRLNDALSLLIAAEKNNSDDIYLKEVLVRQYASMGKLEAAEETVVQALEKQPNNAQSQILAGYFYMVQKDLPRSLEHFKKATILDPNQLQSWLGIGAIELELNQFDKAKATFTKAISINPDSPHAYKGLLHNARLQNKLEAELESLQQLEEDSPSATPALILSKYFALLNKLDVAKKWASIGEKKDSANPTLSEVYQTISLAEIADAMSANNWAKVRESALNGLKYAPNSIELFEALASAELNTGHFSQAQKLAEQLATSYPAFAFHIQGDIHKKEGDLEKSLTSYKKAWEISPSEILGRKILSGINQLGDKNAAQAFAEQWKKEIPDSNYATLAKTNHLLSKQDYSSVIRLLEPIIKAQTNFAQHWNNLAWAYLQTNNSKAIPMARRAIELAPEDPRVLDTLGWALYKDGQVSEALPYLEKAAKLAPNTVEIQEHLKAARDN